MAEKKQNVYEKLMTVQSELKAPKTNYNSFGKYKYRSCEDILEAVKPLLKQVGAIITLTDGIEQIGERFYVKAMASFVNADDGTSIANVAYAREEESKKGCDGSQVTGGSSSYARKYALNGLLCIDDTQDADTQDNNDGGNKEAVTKPVVQVKTAPKVDATATQYVRGQGESTEVRTKDGWKRISELTVEQIKVIHGADAYKECYTELDKELAKRCADGAKKTKTAEKVEKQEEIPF